MHKRSITFKTFEDVPQTLTEVFYFNLSQPELLKYVTDPTKDITEKIRGLSEAKTMREVILIIEDLIMLAYGERSADGKNFWKDDERSKNFMQSAAYPVLYMELASNEQKAAEFIKGILPDELGGDVQKAFEEAQKQAAEIQASQQNQSATPA